MMDARQAGQEFDHCFAPGRVYEISRYHPPNPSADDEFYAHKKSHGMWQPNKIGGATHLDFVFDPERYKEHPESDDVADHVMLIRIKKHLCTGGDKNAQILLATVVDWSPETHPEFPHDEIVVKFFDPLFIIFDRPLFGGKTDVVYEADHAHSHESAALSYLTWLKSQAPEPGDTLPEDFFPHFHGSWSANFTSAQEQFSGKTRPVRLVLTEYIDGINITQMCKLSNSGDFIPIDEKGNELPGLNHPDGVLYHERRMAILKKALDGIQRLKHNGVMSVFPIRPWYIMIEGGWKLYETDGPLPRIVWVNFTKHVTGPFTLAGAISYQVLPKPLNPTEFYDMRYLHVFNGWLLMSWSEHPDYCKKWLENAFEDGDYTGDDEALVLEEAFSSHEEKIRSGESSVPISPGPHTRGLGGYASISTRLP